MQIRAPGDPVGLAGTGFMQSVEAATDTIHSFLHFRLADQIIHTDAADFPVAALVARLVELRDARGQTPRATEVRIHPMPGLVADDAEDRLRAAKKTGKASGPRLQQFTVNGTS